MQRLCRWATLSFLPITAPLRWGLSALLCYRLLGSQLLRSPHTDVPVLLTSHCILLGRMLSSPLFYVGKFEFVLKPITRCSDKHDLLGLQFSCLEAFPELGLCSAPIHVCSLNRAQQVVGRRTRRAGAAPICFPSPFKITRGLIRCRCAAGNTALEVCFVFM